MHWNAAGKKERREFIQRQRRRDRYRQIEREMREKLGSLNTMQLIYYFHMGEMSIREPKDFKRKANEKATTFNRIVNGFFPFSASHIVPNKRLLI